MPKPSAGTFGSLLGGFGSFKIALSGGVANEEKLVSDHA